MKTFLILITLLTLLPSAFSREQLKAKNKVLKILESEELSIEQIESSGHLLKMGELTGAGKGIKLDRLASIIDNDQLIDVEEIVDFELIKKSNVKISDIVKVILKGREIKAKDTLAIIVEE